MNHDIRRKLDRITGILWGGGVTNPVTYIEQISYLIYLKLLDEEESNREQLARLKGSNGKTVSLFPQQAARFRWQNWRFKSGVDLRDFLRDEVFPCMSSEHFGQLAWQFKRMSGSSGLKVQAAMACRCRRRLCSMVFRLIFSLRSRMA